MGLIASENGGTGFSPVSEGIHQAVCYAIYDLGTHFSEKYDKKSHSVLFIWELPDERITIEKDSGTQDLPRAISKKYTLSLNEKANLRKDLQTWRGRAFNAEELAGFDLHKILGASCQIQVIHAVVGEKTYANIAAIMPMPKGQKPLAPENPVAFYSIADSRDVLPEGTPPWVADIIRDSDEWAAIARPTEDREKPDGIPF